MLFVSAPFPIDHSQERSCYNVLELPENAAAADIRKAYRRWYPKSSSNKLNLSLFAHSLCRCMHAHAQSERRTKCLRKPQSWFRTAQVIDRRVTSAGYRLQTTPIRATGRMLRIASWSSRGLTRSEKNLPTLHARHTSVPSTLCPFQKPHANWHVWPKRTSFEDWRAQVLSNDSTRKAYDDFLAHPERHVWQHYSNYYQVCFQPCTCYTAWFCPFRIHHPNYM